MLLDTPRGKGAGRGVEAADAARFAEAARGRYEAASAHRRRVSRPAQWSTRPDPSQETPREETSNGI